jgi:CheY-specific phosphatase CheX
MKETDPIRNFYKMISVSVKRHLSDIIEIDYSLDTYKDLSNENIDYCASIGIKGSLKGDLILFTSKESLRYMFKTVYGIEYEDLEKDDLVQDSLNEFLNSIIASSSELFSLSNFPIEFGIPHKQNISALLNLFTDFRSGVKIRTEHSSVILIFVNKN